VAPACGVAGADGMPAPGVTAISSGGSVAVRATPLRTSHHATRGASMRSVPVRAGTSE